MPFKVKAMSKFLAVVVVVVFAVADMESAQSATGPSQEALCWAKASKRRFVPGSADRKAFIKKCMAAGAERAPRPPAEPSERKN